MIGEIAFDIVRSTSSLVPICTFAVSSSQPDKVAALYIDEPAESGTNAFARSSYIIVMFPAAGTVIFRQWKKNYLMQR